jgi:glycosyltransferase involved in cell wall biosynthesis
MNKLSVITINLNNLNGLQRTINSVINQSLSDFEYIIIDGGSTDGSVDLIKSRNKYVTSWVSEKDKGIYSAMNKGINLAKGEYILFLNSGDFFAKSDVLFNAFKYLTGEDIVYFDLLIQEENNIWVKTYPEKLSFEYFMNDTLPHPASFIRKEMVLRNNKFREDLKIVSDWALFLNAIFLFDATYKYIPTVLSNFNLNGISSLISNQDLIKKEKNRHLSRIRYLLFLKKHNKKLYNFAIKILYN